MHSVDKALHGDNCLIAALVSEKGYTVSERKLALNDPVYSIIEQREKEPYRN